MELNLKDISKLDSILGLFIRDKPYIRAYLIGVLIWGY